MWNNTIENSQAHMKSGKSFEGRIQRSELYELSWDQVQRQTRKQTPDAMRSEKSDHVGKQTIWQCTGLEAQGQSEATMG